MTVAPPLPPVPARPHSSFIPVAKQTYVRSLCFTSQSGFRKTINERVEAFIAANGLKTRDLPAMYAKGSIVALWWVVGYSLWMFAGLAGWHWIAAVGLAISFGLATVAVGFNIMHDASHGGYSNRPSINRLLALSGEVVGLSSFIWRQQHNVWHHTYPNIAGLDEALEADGWLRSSPHDVWKPLHRYQHLYAPIVYAMAGIGLMLVRNFTVYFTGKSSEHFVYPPMDLQDRLTFWAGRIFNIGIYIVVPALVFPWWLALAGFLAFAFTTGSVMAHVLMLAHVNDTLEYVEPTGDPLHVANEWAIHQVQATMDFGPGNRPLSWFVGGLNFQIEHHLFPQTCHLLYPKIGPIVRQTCEEFGVPYHCDRSFLHAIRDHYKALRLFGQPPMGPL